MEATDEHLPALRDLRKQISFIPKETQGLHTVGLRSRTTKVYGLVFVSYTREAETDDRKEEYYAKFLKGTSGDDVLANRFRCG